MAFNINGGTDRVHWFDNVDMISQTVETWSLWFRTTQNATNVHLISLMSNTSRNGRMLIMSSGVLAILGYGATAQRLSVSSGANTYNDGNWHNVVMAVNSGAATTSYLIVDGTQVGQANSSGTFTSFTNYYTVIGDSFDGFWGSYVGDMAEVAHWRGVHLNGAEAAALAQGFSPPRVRPRALDLYAPLVREARSIVSPSRAAPAGTVGVTGTTVVDHPRVYA